MRLPRRQKVTPQRKRRTRRQIQKVRTVRAQTVPERSGCPDRKCRRRGRRQLCGRNDRGEEAQPVSLTLWYTQPELEAYFYPGGSRLRGPDRQLVTAVQVPALDYIEAINDASVKDGGLPGSFCGNAGSSGEGQAGRADPAGQRGHLFGRQFQRESATAVTYKDEKSPILFMRTPVMLVYNENYVSEAPGSIEDIRISRRISRETSQIQDILLCGTSMIFSWTFSPSAIM